MEKRYETRSGDLFVRSWARVRRVSLELHSDLNIHIDDHDNDDVKKFLDLLYSLGQTQHVTYHILDEGDPSGSCFFMAGSPTDTVGSQNFRTFSILQTKFLVAERPMPAMLLRLSASVYRRYRG